MATRGVEKSQRWADRLAPLDRSLILVTLVFGGALSIWYLLDDYGGIARSVVLGVSGLVLGAGPWVRRVEGWVYGQPAAPHSPERAMLNPAPLVAAPRTH